MILEITDLSRSGTGVARAADGRVVFVPFTAPGDQVRVQLVKEDRRFAHAELLEVLRPSEIRVTPPCPIFGKCGGCQWQHVPYSLQWETKIKGVETALKRMEISIASELRDEMPATQIWNYRNRIQLHGNKEELGFYSARSHEIISVAECAVARPEVNALFPQIYAEGQKLERPYKAEAEILPNGSTRVVWNSAHGAAGFRQIHDEQNEKLKKWVSKWITPGVHVYDLFGGSGNLGQAVASKALSVDCVDVSAPEGTKLPEYPGLRFHRLSTLKWLLKRSGGLKPAAAFSSAILDPPREGLSGDHEKIALSLEKMGVRELIAVGCDVDSWAKDVSRFSKRGWKIERIGVLDLFPQTPHVESLALLRL